MKKDEINIMVSNHLDAIEREIKVIQNVLRNEGLSMSKICGGMNTVQSGVNDMFLAVEEELCCE